MFQSLSSMSLSAFSMFSAFGLTSGFANTGAQAAVMTPVQSSTLFRKPADVGDATWDLIVREHRVRASGAKILHLFGEVLSFEGMPIEGATVEIRQCDVNGRYPQDSGQAGDFRGIGHAVTDFEGRYQFRTILPVAYSGRTPHIHAQVRPPSGRKLVTQLYLLDHPENDDDWHYQSLGPSQQAAVSLDPIQRKDGDLEAGFNFVL